MERGELDLWWVAATNPLGEPARPGTGEEAAMGNCPLVVVSEAYADSETSHYAHLLLPAAQWSEKGRSDDQLGTAGHLLPGVPPPLRGEPGGLGSIC